MPTTWQGGAPHGSRRPHHAGKSHLFTRFQHLDNPNPVPGPGPIPPIVVGLSGGVGSGKSAVAALFRAHGAHVLDADEAARHCLQEPQFREAISARFGPGVLDADGDVDRQALADRVFAAEGGDDRKWLEELIHPAVRDRLDAGLRSARQPTPPPWCVVLDAPLLLEGPLRSWCHTIVFIDVPQATRAARVAATRGWDPAELARREAAQLPLADKRSQSEHVISNAGTLEDLEEAVAILASDLRTSSPRGRRRATSDHPHDPARRGL